MFSGVNFIGSEAASASARARGEKVSELCAIAEELAAMCLRMNEVSCTVMEVKCMEEGCPPLETGFAVLDKGVDCKWKVQKALMDVTRDDIVDGLQAMLRGDAPPCACDIVVGGAGLEGDSGGGNPNTSAVPGVDGPSMEEVQMMGMMDMLSSGTL